MTNNERRDVSREELEVGNSRLQAVAAMDGHRTDDADRPAEVRPPGYWWGWQPLHGGTGVSTLARAVRSGYVMPTDTAGHDRWPSFPVAVVVRDHSRGLAAAQEFAGFVDEVPEWHVLGLVVVPSTPARLPRPLEEQLQVVRGAYMKPRATPAGDRYQPNVWRMPWVERWFVGEPVSTINTPNPYRSLVRDLVLATAAPIAL